MAQAGTTPPAPAIIIDGVVPDGSAGQINLSDPSGNEKELGPLNSNTTKIGVIHNDVVPTLGFTNPNGQVDLKTAWLNTAKDTPDGDDWIYFAWERDANSGSGFIAYEFMKNEEPAACLNYDPTDATIVAGCNPWANRTDGDFMILWDQQGGSKKLWLRTWSGTAPDLVLSAPIEIPSNYGRAEYSPDGYRGEAAVNITDVIYGGTPRCLAFANIIPSTVTGNSDTADYKDTILRNGFTLSNCTTTTTTTPKLADGTSNVPTAGTSITTNGVVEVKDSAVISLSGGSATPGGTIDFTLCKASNTANADCDTGTGAVSVLVDDDKAVTGSAYPVTVVSSSAWITAAGRYCWQAEYTGVPSAGIGGSSDVTKGECFLVNPVDPTLSTTAGPDVVLGTAVTDSAALGGTAPKPTASVIHTTAPAPATRTPAGGTITFKLYGPSSSSCGSLVFTSTAVSVSGNNTYNSPTYTPTAAGDYHWVAVYTGDSPNTNGKTHNATCTDTGEDVTVTTVASSLTSAQTWVPSDSVTVSAPAGGNLAGTVSFDFYTNGTCAGTAVYTTTEPVSGASPQTVLSGNAPAQTATGSFSWKVSYTSTNAAQRNVPASCHETSALTVTNGGTISSP
ncbi:hemagglutinin [Intrasporangium sp. DVR]|uniref:hemagglutinin n=1 Tax=Intrasporangium sp. DVR TaxID=3127867 RepID=UPI00313A55AC